MAESNTNSATVDALKKHTLADIDIEEGASVITARIHALQLAVIQYGGDESKTRIELDPHIICVLRAGRYGHAYTNREGFMMAGGDVQPWEKRMQNTVKVSIGNLKRDCSISYEAADAVRLSFNPAGNEDVAVVKALGAALLTQLETTSKNAGRELSIAKTHLETAVMWAVKGLTKQIQPV